MAGPYRWSIAGRTRARPRVQRLPLVAVVALVAALALLVPALAGGSTTAQELARARRALARYQDVRVAEAEGYVLKPIDGAVCVSDTTRTGGAMGIHYLNPALIDGRVDPLRPEVLLYAADGRGGLRLLGVEYFEPDTGQPVPSVFGQPLEGPMAGHEPGMPVHYDLHVWLWHANPDGIFATWNRTVRC